jgi:hypothetical protein
LVWQKFRIFFAMKIDKFWWMKVRFTSVGDEFSQPLFFTSQSQHPRSVFPIFSVCVELFNYICLDTVTVSMKFRYIMRFLWRRVTIPRLTIIYYSHLLYCLVSFSFDLIWMVDFFLNLVHLCDVSNLQENCSNFDAKFSRVLANL